VKIQDAVVAVATCENRISVSTVQTLIPGFISD
jgi:hypothetical protein